MDWLRAYAIAGSAARPLPAERTSVSAAVGRVLAEPVRAVIEVPAFDTAAMDGYAVTGPGPWHVEGQVLAGPATPTPPMRPGIAVEIATGAVVPDDADAVLPYEDCRRSGEMVGGQRGPRDHIRRTGEDLRPGDEIAPAGRTVTATVAAAAIQAGVEQLDTHRRPSMTLLVTGTEIITRGEPGPGQVRDSFTGLIDAITTRAGGRLTASRHIPDAKDLLEQALATADGDVIVVSGSSSAGAADHLRTVLDVQRAAWHVRGVACRPGHTQSLAALPDGRWVVSLPGNPYAGLVAALTLVEPLLQALSGRPATPMPTAPVTGKASLIPGGVRIVPVRDGRIVPGRGSASLHTAAAADALAVLPDDWTDGKPGPILAIP